MLKNHARGLQVSETLRRVRPNIQTILITGFPSTDLREQAEESDVFAFFAKPFDLDALTISVDQAVKASSLSTRKTLVGFVEVDEKGGIVYRNSRAREMFTKVVAGEDAGHISEYFLEKTFVNISESPEEWFEVMPFAVNTVKWYVRGTKFSDKKGAFLLLLGEEHGNLRNSTPVNLLCGRAHFEIEWPFESRILIIDNEEMVRRVIVRQFGSVGAVCHSADNYESALKTLKEDEGIGFILLDYHIPDRESFAGGLEGIARGFHKINPRAVIVGHSLEGKKEEFEEAGIKLFIRKPWSMRKFMSLVLTV